VNELDNTHDRLLGLVNCFFVVRVVPTCNCLAPFLCNDTHPLVRGMELVAKFVELVFLFSVKTINCLLDRVPQKGLIVRFPHWKWFDFEPSILPRDFHAVQVVPP
jgi:hypothetical protein